MNTCQYFRSFYGIEKDKKQTGISLSVVTSPPCAHDQLYSGPEHPAVTVRNLYPLYRQLKCESLMKTIQNISVPYP